MRTPTATKHRDAKGEPVVTGQTEGQRRARVPVLGPHATGVPPDRLVLHELPRHVVFVQRQLALSEQGKVWGWGWGWG